MTTHYGSTVADVTFSRGVLNNAGEVAFYATLADNRRGIWAGEPAQAEGVSE
jgi:hypothetical protein